MSLAEFYIENGIDPEWDAPSGMDAFLRRHARENEDGDDIPIEIDRPSDRWPQEEYPAPAGNRKRGRDDESEDSADGDRAATGPRSGPVASISFSNEHEDGGDSSSRCRPAKRRRHGRDAPLVAFHRPFPCAFLTKRGGCRFRATCSYHHGVPEICGCHFPRCPKGHPHRRAPRRCDHGALGACRWNSLGECSFHHGVAESCACTSLQCPRAHPNRVRRNGAERAERNARMLFLGTSSVEDVKCNVSHIHAKFREWISAASLGEVQGDPIVGVTVDPERKYAFVEFQKAEMATACLAAFNNLVLEGWGEVTLERPKAHDPSLAPAPDPSLAALLDASRLGPNVAALDPVNTEQTTGGKKAEGVRGETIVSLLKWSRSILDMPVTGPQFNNGTTIMTKKSKRLKKAAENEARQRDNTNHYRKWRKEQKALNKGVSNKELRKRYLHLFPQKR